MIVDDPITRELVEGPRLWQLARRGLRRGQLREATAAPAAEASVDPAAKERLAEAAGRTR